MPKLKEIVVGIGYATTVLLLLLMIAILYFQYPSQSIKDILQNFCAVLVTALFVGGVLSMPFYFLGFVIDIFAQNQPKGVLGGVLGFSIGATAGLGLGIDFLGTTTGFGGCTVIGLILAPFGGLGYAVAYYNGKTIDFKKVRIICAVVLIPIAVSLYAFLHGF